MLVNRELVQRTTLSTDHPCYSTLRAIKQSGRLNCDKRTAELLGWPSDTPIYRVTAIEDAGIVSLYDIEVEEAHEYVVNGIVSHNTINLPNSATLDDVRDAYMLAWNLGCLGITIFRDGSKGEQVLNVGVKQEGEAKTAQPAAETAAAQQEIPPQEVTTIPAITAPRAAASAGLYQNGVKVRPEVMAGYTRQVRAPEGKVNVTLNSDEDGLLEVFVNVGKAGSDVAALAEALGRLISLHLRIDSPLSQNERAGEVARQLGAIGGSTSIGFGANRVRSLPDAVARAIEVHLTASAQPASAPALPPAPAAPSESASSAGGTGQNGSGYPNGHGPTPGTLALYTVTGNLCPQCGNNTLYMEEGCKKCVSCGHSEC